MVIDGAAALMLRDRAPRFVEWLESAGPADVEQSPHGDESVLVVDGIHLASALDPAGEASFLVEQALPGRVPEAWVYGTGSLLVAAALERADRVNVVGLSARASAAELAHRPPVWLADPRVTLLAPHEAPMLREPCVVASAELRLGDVSPIRDAILFARARSSQEAWLAERVADRDGRGRANRARYPLDAPVSSIFGSGRPWAVVAAGGPTLLAGAAAIASRRHEMTLIAVSTALGPLERVGLRPDIVVMIDPLAALGRHLDAVPDLAALRDVPLVYAIDIDAGVLARWPGPRFAALLALPSYASLARDHALGELFCSGTVTHTAVDLAVKMGARDVVLVGADFAYPGGNTHAEGTPFRRAIGRSKVVVESVGGERIPTDVNLLGYLRDLERYIGQAASVRFWNASTEGARIDGAERFLS